MSPGEDAPDFHVYDSGYNPVARTMPYLLPDLMIQITKRLKIPGEMSH